MIESSDQNGYFEQLIESRQMTVLGGIEDLCLEMLLHIAPMSQLYTVLTPWVFL